ncbi:unnamed protein product [Camellia sinensis]
MARIPIFDGTNYEFWSVKMRTLFLSKGLLDTVQDGYNHEANQQKDAAALSHIQQGVSDWIFPSIKDATTAKQAWDILLRFSPQGPTLPGPTLQGPTLPGPTLQGPTLPGPTLPHYRTVLRPTDTDLRGRAASHLIVATLVATVAFTAGFTMPGGYNSNDGLNQGMAILTREAAFKAFMVTDTIAMSLSISAVLIHFYAAMPDDPHMPEKQVYRAAHLIRYAVVAMVLAFVTGTYAVLAHSSGLAISVCVIGCLPLFFFLITRINKRCRITENCTVLYRIRYRI